MRTNFGKISLPRWLKYCLTASATALTIVGIFGGISLGAKSDWLAFYTAGYALIHDWVPHLYHFDKVQSWQAHIIGDNFIGYMYAPAYSLPFMPLAVLSITEARVLWLAVSLLASLCAVKISTRWTCLGYGNSFVGMMAFAPFSFTLAVGQISPITLLLYSSVVALEWQEKPSWLSGFLAGLTLYKPQLIIPIIFFWIIKRRWLTLAGFTIAAAGVAATSIIISPAATRDYILLSTSFMKLAENATQTGANAAFFAISPFLGVVIGIIVLLMLYIVLRYPLNRYSLAMVWLAPVFTTPYIGIYDLFLIALPVSMLIPLVSKDRWLQFAFLLLWFTPIAAIFIFNIYPMMLSILFIFSLSFFRSLNQSSSINRESQNIST